MVAEVRERAMAPAEVRNAEIEAAAEGARVAYAAGTTKPLEWRRAQLRALVRMMTESSERIHQAVFSDLGKNPVDAHLTEVSAVVDEAKLALKHLNRWTRDRRARSPLSLGTSRAWVQRQPLGTVLIIGPWNYPLHLLLVPLVGAIAAGNSVVLKPSEVAPACSRLVAELIPRYLDADAIRVLEGGVAETTTLLNQPWDHIFYTGNGTVGSIVMAAAAKHLTPVTLELGGKSPVWVDGSASLVDAARSLAWGKFTNCGQTCVAPDYVLTTADVATALADEVRTAIDEFYGPDPRSSRDYGRIVNARHAERLAGLLDAGTTVAGGVYDVEDRYIAPTVLLDVKPEDQVMQEEIFGPILPIVIVRDHAEAIRFINARPKPLALYAFTNRREVRDAFSQQTTSGGMSFNSVMLHLGVPDLPFGGVGPSGMGAYHGEHSLRTFSHERGVLRKLAGVDLTKMARPPFTDRKIKMLIGRAAAATKE